jgi:hypothetical protein
MGALRGIFKLDTLRTIKEMFKVETLKDLIEDLARVVVEDFNGEIIWIGIHPKNTSKMTTDANKHQMLKAKLPHNCEFIGETLSYSTPTENYYTLTFIWDAKDANPRIRNFGDLKMGFSIKKGFYVKRILGKKLLILDNTEDVPKLIQFFSNKVNSLLETFERPDIFKAFWKGRLNDRELKLEIGEISQIYWAVGNRKEKRRRLLREAIDFNLKFFELLQSY